MKVLRYLLELAIESHGIEQVLIFPRNESAKARLGNDAGPVDVVPFVKHLVVVEKVLRWNLSSSPEHKRRAASSAVNNMSLTAILKAGARACVRLSMRNY
jgi:hypothetical protein